LHPHPVRLLGDHRQEHPPGHSLLLPWLPGLAWLELAVGRDHDGLTTYSQRAIFQPRGLAGHAYWRSISPFHSVVFGGMLRNITAAERAGRSADRPALAAR